LTNDNNFTKLDSNFIKNNNKVTYWLSSNDKYSNNTKNSSKIDWDYSTKSHYTNNNISNIENNTAVISINCDEIKMKNTTPLYIHYRIINHDGKLSDVYVNKIDVSECKNW
jgi:hypothetical protein